MYTFIICSFSHFRLSSQFQIIFNTVYQCRSTHSVDILVLFCVMYFIQCIAAHSSIYHFMHSHRLTVCDTPYDDLLFFFSFFLFWIRIWFILVINPDESSDERVKTEHIQLKFHSFNNRTHTISTDANSVYTEKTKNIKQIASIQRGDFCPVSFRLATKKANRMNKKLCVCV